MTGRLAREIDLKVGGSIYITGSQFMVDGGQQFWR